MWKTAWQPSMPRRIASASPRSPSTTSASRPAAFSGRRASTTTSSPRSRRRLTTRDPMKPGSPGHESSHGAPSYSGYSAGAILRWCSSIRTARRGRARQRALTIGVAPDQPDLSELRELLRTAGVAVAGEMVQRRERPDPDRYFGRGKLTELKQAVKEADANLVAVDDELLPRQERNLEEELGVPVIDRTAIILDIFADHARLGRGQAPGGARAARVQPRADARAVDAPRASRRRPHGRRHRHQGPGRVPDRDRPPPGARPHLRAAAAPRRDEGHARDDAPRARAGGAAERRARRVHERGKVDAPRTR